jgi:hypothetical protein
MKMYGVTVVADSLRFPEDLRWHLESGWFTDKAQNAVLRVRHGAPPETVAYIEGVPSVQRWLHDGTTVLVSMSDLKLLGIRGTPTTLRADLSRLVFFTATTWVWTMERPGGTSPAIRGCCP